jgi:hypothetical protein
MAMTFEQFMEASGSEYVAGNIIRGIMADRKIIGTYDGGKFQLNEDGQLLLEELEADVAGAPRPTRRRKNEAADASAEAAVETPAA